MKITLHINEIAEITGQLVKHVKRQAYGLQALSGLRSNDKVERRTIFNLITTYPAFYTEDVKNKVLDLLDQREQDAYTPNEVHPATLTSEWLLKWADNWDANDNANLKLEGHYEKQASLVDFAKTEIRNPIKAGCTVTEYSDSLGISKDEFYSKMQELGVFKLSDKYAPMRVHVNQGYFSIKEYYSKQYQKLSVQTFITEKGVAWLNKKIMKVA